MAHVCVMVPVDVEPPPRSHRYFDSDGNPCAWLHVGADGELGLYGTLDAMRRLGEAVLVAATTTDARVPPERATRGRGAASGQPRGCSGGDAA